MSAKPHKWVTEPRKSEPAKCALCGVYYSSPAAWEPCKGRKR